MGSQIRHNAIATKVSLSCVHDHFLSEGAWSPRAQAFFLTRAIRLTQNEELFRWKRWLAIFSAAGEYPPRSFQHLQPQGTKESDRKNVGDEGRRRRRRRGEEDLDRTVKKAVRGGQTCLAQRESWQLFKAAVCMDGPFFRTDPWIRGVGQL